MLETSDHLGRSVGYISDIERSRTGPPDLELVRKLEELFDTEDERLLKLAISERNSMPTHIVQEIQNKPLLRDVFFRLKNKPEQELRDWLEADAKKT